MSSEERETRRQCVDSVLRVLTAYYSWGEGGTRAAAHKDTRCQAGSKFETQADWRRTG